MISTTSTLLFVVLVFLVTILASDASISCIDCSSVSFNLPADPDLNTNGCRQVDSEICELTLRIDYKSHNESFALMGGSSSPLLILTNGKPQVTDTTFIWFTETRVQRMASIICFSASTCGLDKMKELYKDTFRSFDYTSIQRKLSDLLYSSSAVSADLKCASSSDASVPCSNGYCQAISDGNGIAILPSCVANGLVPTTNGLVVSQTSIPDLVQEQGTVMYVCNKPMCNSKDTIKQVLQILADAKLIPKPSFNNAASTLFRSEQGLLLASLFLLLLGLMITTKN